MIYFLAAILLFGILIAVHEFGHFIAAKCCGVKVYEFSVGMGPALWKHKRGDTEYSLRALPIGGYCALEGEDEEADTPTSLHNQSFLHKFIIYVAGAAMNFLAGIIILLMIYMPAKQLLTAEIAAVDDPTLPLMVGDEIYALNGERVYIHSDVAMLLNTLPRDEAGTLHLTLLRDGKKIRETLTLKDRVDENGKEYRSYGFSYGGVTEATPLLSAKYAWNNALDFARLVRMSFRMMFAGDVQLEDFSGPVGVIKTITKVGNETEKADGRRAALTDVLFIGAMIAVNLAVMNLVPIPALDGGKVFFLLLNGIGSVLFHRTIPEKYENWIHMAGFVLLMGLMLLITFQDILKPM